MLYRCRTTHCLLYQRASLRYQQLPALQKSNMIYQFSCDCDNYWYAGCTSQWLLDKIKQHVLKSIRSCSSSQKFILPARHQGMVWNRMEWKFRYGIWKMPEWNGMEDFKNGMEDNVPYFHTNFTLDFVQCIYKEYIRMSGSDK